jgi:hypothetical protein
MNWTKGFLRLWLVGSLLWAIPVGWLTWPGNSPQQYAGYWYYRLAHPEILKERRDLEAEWEKQREEFFKDEPPQPPHQLTAEELADLASRLLPRLTPESEQLHEFRSLEEHLDWHGERVGEWAAYMFAPPFAVLIVGSSLLWALRGFRRTR